MITPISLGLAGLALGFLAHHPVMPHVLDVPRSEIRQEIREHAQAKREERQEARRERRLERMGDGKRPHLHRHHHPLLRHHR